MIYFGVGHEFTEKLTKNFINHKLIEESNIRKVSP